MQLSQMSNPDTSCETTSMKEEKDIKALRLETKFG